jgi:hypothetical protein
LLLEDKKGFLLNRPVAPWRERRRGRATEREERAGRSWREGQEEGGARAAP